MGTITKAVRMYGAKHLRLEEFALPEIKDHEILVKIISDGICMSTYKLLQQGKTHKRCPQDIDINPIIIGHEFSGRIVQVGKKWQHQFTAGEKFALQPAYNQGENVASPGYSYEFFGGAATHCIIPEEVMEAGCLLPYDGAAYFEASLAEPTSCIIGGYNTMYHTNKQDRAPILGIKKGGNVLILGGCGPMGLCAIEYALMAGNTPQRIVVTDVDAARIHRAKKLISPDFAQKKGVELHYINPTKNTNIYQDLLTISQGKGYDDIFVYAPSKELVELGDSLMGFDGCMNFFAGSPHKDFTANINLYNCHYTSSRIVCSTGGNVQDLKDALALSAKGTLRPAIMISHICGLDAVAKTTAALPHICVGKVLSYPPIHMPLTAIADFEELGKKDPLFAKLHLSVAAHNGLWNAEAEAILLKHFKV